MEINDCDGFQLNNALPNKPSTVLSFGRYKKPKPKPPLPDNVRKVYSVLQRATGEIGGSSFNCSIYGELTAHSMEKVIFQIIYTL